AQGHRRFAGSVGRGQAEGTVGQVGPGQRDGPLGKLDWPRGDEPSGPEDRNATPWRWAYRCLAENYHFGPDVVSRMTLYQVRMYTIEEKRLKRKWNPRVQRMDFVAAKIEGRRLR